MSIDGLGLAGAFFLADDGESLPLPLDELEEPLLLLLLLLDATVDGNFKGWRNRFAKSSSSSSSSSQSCKPDGTACSSSTPSGSLRALPFRYTSRRVRSRLGTRRVIRLFRPRTARRAAFSFAPSTFLATNTGFKCSGIARPSISSASSALDPCFQRSTASECDESLWSSLSVSAPRRQLAVCACLHRSLRSCAARWRKFLWRGFVAPVVVASSSSSSPRLSRRRRRLARWRRRRRRAIRTQLIPTSPPRAPRSHVVSRSTLNEIRTVRRVPSRGGRGGVNGIDGDDENDGEVDADASVAVVALGAPTRTTRGKIAVLLDASSDGAQSKRPELASGFTGERE